jgi:hypothetical protein
MSRSQVFEIYFYRFFNNMPISWGETPRCLARFSRAMPGGNPASRERGTTMDPIIIIIPPVFF